MKKKGQISIFILLAIVIAFSFLIIFIFSKNVGTEKFQAQYKTLAEKKSAVASVESNINSCLQLSSEDALLIIGKQGGFIFKEIGSSVSSDIAQNNGMVYWVIRNPKDQPPAYPLTESFVGLTQVPLIKKEGAGALSSKYPFIQNEVEKYAEYEFRQCMNITLFEEKGITIKEKRSASITAEFGNSDTTFYLDYPIEVSAGDYTEKKDKQTIYRSPVRFLALYSIAKTLIYKDMDLFFSLDNSTANSQAYNPLNSEVYVEIARGLEYDTIRVTDTKNRQNIYSLVFLRQNRAPVVRYIPNYEVNISDNLNISFVVIDPDEDNFTESATAEKIDLSTGAHDKVAARLNFKTSKSDIGYYIYNFSAKDAGGLSDWQNEVVVKIKCEYRASATGPDASGKWKDDTGKTFDYNPTCCDVGADPTGEYSRLSFTPGCGGIVVPPAGCTPACGLCEECVSGGCVPKTCDIGYTCNDATGDCELPPIGTCTEGDTNCEVTKSYECTGGVWILIRTYDCGGCHDEICHEEQTGTDPDFPVYETVCEC